MSRSLYALLAAVAVLGGASIASAADLPVKAAPYKAPAPVMSWTGCYVGANLGGGRLRSDWIDPPTGLLDSHQRASGVVGGGQLGCDYQASAWVFGVQGMFDWSNMNDRQDEPLFPGFVDETHNRWFGTLTGRVGYLVTPAVLLYGKGGAAWIRNNYQTFAFGNFNADANVTHSGWTVGGGFEWKFAPNWSVFAEYNHMEFGDHNTWFRQPGGFQFNIFINNQRTDVGLVGVNYRFYSP